MQNPLYRNAVAVGFHGRLLGAICVFAAMVCPASAEPVRVAARQDTSIPSYFTLNFPVLGELGRNDALIARTDLELEIDAVAGTARFVRYEQDVDPLTLPGGISTGNLRIEIVPNSSTGTFDPATGQFLTSETYLVHFDGDLSAYGLMSPVALPSSSTGFASVASTTSGQVDFRWDGVGQLANPFAPGTMIDFTYICSLFASFAPQASAYVSLNMIPEVMNLNVSASTTANLVGFLNSVLVAIGDDNIVKANRDLNAFVQRVRLMRGNRLSVAAADSLIASTQNAIQLLAGIAQPQD